MSKRAHKKHARRPRDLYGTPAEPVAELLPFLAPGTLFVEPCAAGGLLVGHLEAAGHTCVLATDIHPLAPTVRRRDALTLTAKDIPAGAVIITNPPWSRELLHALILHLSDLAPVWLLFDAGWPHLTGRSRATKLFKDCYARCRIIKSVGRVQWEFEGSTKKGFEDSAWYYFDKDGHGPPVTYAQGLGPHEEPQARGPVRICLDCRQPIGARDRWRMVRRAGVSTVVHVDCEHPRGVPAEPAPMALFPWHDQPQADQCDACRADHQPLASGAYYCAGSAVWRMPDGQRCPHALRHIVHEGGDIPRNTIAAAST